MPITVLKNALSENLRQGSYCIIVVSGNRHWWKNCFSLKVTLSPHTSWVTFLFCISCYPFSGSLPTFLPQSPHMSPFSSRIQLETGGINRHPEILFQQSDLPRVHLQLETNQKDLCLLWSVSSPKIPLNPIGSLWSPPFRTWLDVPPHIHQSFLSLPFGEFGKDYKSSPYGENCESQRNLTQIKKRNGNLVPLEFWSILCNISYSRDVLMLFAGINLWA